MKNLRNLNFAKSTKIKNLNTRKLPDLQYCTKDIWKRQNIFFHFEVRIAAAIRISKWKKMREYWVSGELKGVISQLGTT